VTRPDAGKDARPATIEALRVVQVLLDITPENPDAYFSLSHDGIVALAAAFTRELMAIARYQHGMVTEEAQRAAARAELDRRIEELMLGIIADGKDTSEQS
jgi:hypothetical protein